MATPVHRIEINDEQAAEISSCVSNKQCRLTTLRLQWCDMSESACQVVCEGLTGNNHLTALDLSWNDTGNGLVTAVSRLLHENTTLTELDISHNKITDISALCGSIQTNGSLRVLDLSGTHSLPQHMSQLCAALQVNTGLQVLLMDKCALNDASVHELTATVTTHPSLKVLSLRDNSAITASSVVGLIQNTGLEVLDVRGLCVRTSSVRPPLPVWLRQCAPVPPYRCWAWVKHGRDTECAAFLTKLCESYPSHGPLQALYIDCDKPTVKRAGAALARRLNIPHLVRHHAVGMMTW